MLEIIIIGASVWVMYKAADLSKQPGLLWGAITLGACIASVVLMPGWPMVRVGVAFVVMLVAMIVTNMIRQGN